MLGQSEQLCRCQGRNGCLSVWVNKHAPEIGFLDPRGKKHSAGVLSVAECMPVSVYRGTENKSNICYFPK